MATRIIEVRRKDGVTPHPQWYPLSTLFEIAEGDHKGKRGADRELYDLVGEISWDQDCYSVYETGEIIKWKDVTIPYSELERSTKCTTNRL